MKNQYIFRINREDPKSKILRFFYYMAYVKDEEVDISTIAGVTDAEEIEGVDTETNSKRRHRAWFIQRNYYFDTHDKDDNVVSNESEDDWRIRIVEDWQKLIDTGSALNVRMIFHDKDESNGVLKYLHVHAVVEFDNAISDSQVRKRFSLSSNKGNASYVHDSVKVNRYLIHINEKNIKDHKYLYGRDKIIELGAFTKRYEDIIAGNSDERLHGLKAMTNLDKLVARLGVTVSEHGLTIRESKIYLFKILKLDPANYEHVEFMQHLWTTKCNKIYDDGIQSYIKNKVEELSVGGRELTSVYVSGLGGSGKSALAAEIGSNLIDGRVPFKTAGSGKGKTPDLSDGYLTEPLLIDDDVLAANYELDEFLKTADPYVYSGSPSRNTNKAILANYIIFTSSNKLFEYASDLMAYSHGGSSFQINKSVGSKDKPVSPLSPYGPYFEFNKELVEQYNKENNTDYDWTYFDRPDFLEKYVDAHMDEHVQKNHNSGWLKYCQKFNEYKQLWAVWEKNKLNATPLKIDSVLRDELAESNLNNMASTRDRFFQVVRRLPFYVKVDSESKKARLYLFRVKNIESSEFDYDLKSELDYDGSDESSIEFVGKEFSGIIKDNQVKNARIQKKISKMKAQLDAFVNKIVQEQDKSRSGK